MVEVPGAVPLLIDEPLQENGERGQQDDRESRRDRHAGHDNRPAGCGSARQIPGECERRRNAEPEAAQVVDGVAALTGPP